MKHSSASWRTKKHENIIFILMTDIGRNRINLLLHASWWVDSGLSRIEKQNDFQMKHTCPRYIGDTKEHENNQVYIVDYETI